jgi:hypothetical protein
VIENTKGFSDEDAEEREQVMMEKGKELMEEIGGPDRYLALSIEEQIRFAKRLVCEAQICLGERAYEWLPLAEKAAVDYWVWSGCGMQGPERDERGSRRDVELVG